MLIMILELKNRIVSKDPNGARDAIKGLVVVTKYQDTLARYIGWAPRFEG